MVVFIFRAAKRGFLPDLRSQRHHKLQIVRPRQRFLPSSSRVQPALAFCLEERASFFWADSLCPFISFDFSEMWKVSKGAGTRVSAHSHAHTHICDPRTLAPDVYTHAYTRTRLIKHSWLQPLGYTKEARVGVGGGGGVTAVYSCIWLAPKY